MTLRRRIPHPAALALAATLCAGGPACEGRVGRTDLEASAGNVGLLKETFQASGPCGLTATGPRWIEEGQPLAVRLSCATGADISIGDLRPAALPAGARFDVTTAELHWTPALDQAGQYVIAFRHNGTGEETNVTVGVVDAFAAPGNLPITAAASYPDELGLPVMHLQVSPALQADAYSDATVTYRGHVYRAHAKHRGATSLQYPKKSLTVKFSRDDLFNEPDRAGGFIGKRKIALLSSFDDNSHLRTRLAYQLWDRVDGEKIRVQTFSAAVYINGAYQGLYVVADFIDEDLLAAQGLPADGHLYKAVGHAAFDSSNGLDLAFEKKAGAPQQGDPDAFSPLAALTDWLVGVTEGDFTAQAPERLDLRDYRAWFIVTSLMQAHDTMGKNTYHLLVPGAPARVVPWDFNHSFGQNWATRRETPEARPQDHASNNLIWRRLAADPTLGPALRARYSSALEDELRTDRVLQLVDALATEIGPAARRDERRWRADHRAAEPWSDRSDFTDFDGEVAYIKGWISQRWTLVADALRAPREVAIGLEGTGGVPSAMSGN